MTSIPLVRMLTDAGYGARREVSKLVNAGLVEVNGRIATSYTEKVDPEVDAIVVTGNKVAQVAAHRVYLIMNKPEGYLSTTEDDRDRPTVLDLLPESVRAAGLHPAGRLDEDSTGLLVLTNDGQLTYELTHPRFEHEKEYWVATTGRLTDADVAQLEQGVEVEEQMTWPARVRILLGQSPYTYSITIHEGRKRQVRMMLAAIGQQVAMLKRVRLGGLLLGDLAEGAWRELTPPELKELMRKRPVDLRQSGVGPATPRGAAHLASASDASSERQAPLASRQPRTYASPSERADSGARYEQRDRPPVRERDTRAHDRDDSRPEVGQPYRASANDRGPRRFERGGAGAYSERRDRPPARDRDARPYERRESRPAAEQPYRRPADDRGPRGFERGPSGADSDKRDRPPARDRDARPYERRESRPSVERPYRRPADDRGPGRFERGGPGAYSDRRDRPPAGDRDARPYERRESRPAGERPYRRPTDDRGPRSTERTGAGAYSERRDRPPARDRDARPYERRESRPAAERPYRRPADDRGPRSTERGGAGAYSERRDRPPARDRDARPYERRESRPATERPYRRPADDRGPRSTERTGAGAYSERRDRPPSRDRDARPYERRESRPATERRDFERGGAGAFSEGRDRRSAGPPERRPFTRPALGDRAGHSYQRPTGERVARPYSRGPSAARPGGSFRGSAGERRSAPRSDSYPRSPRDGRTGDDRRPRGHSGVPFRQPGSTSRRPRPQARGGRGTPPGTSPSTGRRPPGARR